jgi:hypothetical protein
MTCPSYHCLCVQLPPVKDKALYSQRSKKFNCYQKLGRSIWRQLNRCVVLTFIFRTKARTFTALLDRLRWGECTPEDFLFLSGLVVNNQVSMTGAGDDGDEVYHPCIVPGNKLREALNRIAVLRHAKNSNTRVLIVPALDKRRGIPVPEPDRSKLLDRPEHLCGFRPGYLYLVKGARYILKRNKAPELGLYNSTPLTLEEILFNPGHAFQSMPVSPGEPVVLSTCPAALLLNVNTPRHDNFESFGDGILPMLPSEKHWQLPLARRCVPKDKWPRRSYTRKQFELVLAYALTAHAAQGLTLSRMDADLESCKFYGSAYTILTRCESAENIHLIRPFQRAVLRKRPSKDLVADWQRLATLETSTLARFRSFIRLQPGDLLDPSHLGTPPSERRPNKQGLLPEAVATVSDQLRQLDLAPLPENWIGGNEGGLDCLAYHMNRPSSRATWDRKRVSWANRIKRKLRHRPEQGPSTISDQLAMLRSAASSLRVAIHVLRDQQPQLDFFPPLSRPPRSHLYLLASDSNITTCAVPHRQRRHSDSDSVASSGDNSDQLDSSSGASSKDSSSSSSDDSDRSSHKSIQSSDDERTCAVVISRGPRKDQPCGRRNNPCITHAAALARRKASGASAPNATATKDGDVRTSKTTSTSALRKRKRNPRTSAGKRQKTLTTSLSAQLCQRTNTPPGLADSLASAMLTGAALTQAVATWLQEGGAVQAGFYRHELIRLDSLLMAHAAQSDAGSVLEQERHTDLLAARVQEMNWLLPTDSVPDLIRTQGDCFPDSMAYLLWSERVVGRIPSRTWAKQRSRRSATVRTDLADWLRDKEHTILPSPDASSVTFGLLPRSPGESWEAFCDRMSLLRGAGCERYAEAAMIAAAAVVHKRPITVASSGFLHGLTFYPGVNAAEQGQPLRIAHSAYSRGHFVPAVTMAATSMVTSPLTLHR